MGGSYAQGSVFGSGAPANQNRPDICGAGADGQARHPAYNGGTDLSGSRHLPHLFLLLFPTKEDLVVETLYLKQPRILAYIRTLLSDPTLSWRQAVEQFLYACCYGEKHGIAILTVEDQQRLFRRLSKESYRLFREKQFRLFHDILECLGIRADAAKVHLFTNLSLTVMVIRRAIQDSLPLLVPEAADETVAFQIHAIVDCLESMKQM